MRWSVRVAAVGLSGLLTACASTQAGSIPVDRFSDNQAPVGGEYTIGVGDLLSIQVFNQENLSGRMRVRSDGRISLPLVNDIDAVGKAPAQLALELETLLKSTVLNPRVTVVVEESSPLSISAYPRTRRNFCVPDVRATHACTQIAPRFRTSRS